MTIMKKINLIKSIVINTLCFIMQLFDNSNFFKFKNTQINYYYSIFNVNKNNLLYNTLLYRKYSFYSSFLVKNAKTTVQSRRIKGMTLNFGPNHPAAHGILRLTLQLQGEVLQRVDPQFGFLHRGTEKLVEMRSYLQALPYFDRFDYVANIFQEHVYCLAIESLTHTTESINFCLNYIRTLFDELSRVLNHLLTLSATCLDLGSMGPIFWAFEERERLMELFERISGARMHTALYKPHTFDWTVLNQSFFLDLARFLMRCGRSLSGAVMGLLNNRILKSRLCFVGSLSTNKIFNYSIGGIIARSAGVQKDLRINSRIAHYGAYWYLSFRTFLGRRGDNLDRFLIRIKETFECFRLVSQVIATVLFYYTPIRSTNTISNHRLLQQQEFMSSLSISKLMQFSENIQFFNLLCIKSKFTGMEELITHFKYFSGDIQIRSGITYASVETPKGELGVMLVSSSSSKPYRLKVRTPVSHNMHLIPSVCAGFVFGDFVMTFCSLDIVLGEIDR